MSLSDLDPEVGGFGCEPLSAVSLTIELNQEIKVPLNPRQHWCMCVQVLENAMYSSSKGHLVAMCYLRTFKSQDLNITVPWFQSFGTWINCSYLALFVDLFIRFTHILKILCETSQGIRHFHMKFQECILEWDNQRPEKIALHWYILVPCA